MLSRGLSEEQALSQLAIFREGAKHTVLERACTLNDGIVRLSPEERESLAADYAAAAAQGRAMEFVPASGAATRMFKGLQATWNRTDVPGFAQLASEAAAETASQTSANPDAKETVAWFTGLRAFPFYDALAAILSSQGKDAEALYAAQDYRPFLDALLSPQGMHCAHRPKALIPFHRHPGAPRTALEEHLAEAADLVRDGGGECRLHFTVSPDHEIGIQALLDKVHPGYEAAGIRLRIGLSRQEPFTDTLAADQDDKPLRNPDGSLNFRPGGHGALLQNLFRTGGDIVFIKNIDNVVPDRLRVPVLLYRKALGGYLVRMQQRVHAYLDRLRALPSGPQADLRDHEALLKEIARFAERDLCAVPPENLRGPARDTQPPAFASTLNATLNAQAAYLIRALDRPLRVCAMVKNEGEPGGGPFWVRGKDGVLRPQIVESAQVDLGVPGQRAIVAAATHFNPVDMVCGLRNGKGEAYPLRDFVDADACFVTAKSKDGKTVKALELPGLWNGSMAFWNTLFVETPVETFNPVKTVNDLLRPNHQG